MKNKYLFVGILLGALFSALLPNTYTGILSACIIGIVGGITVYILEKRKK